MGRSFLFECPKCNYKTRVSGGADEGRDLSVQTILCRDCRKLHDAVIKIRVTNNANGASAPPDRRTLRRTLITPEKPPPFESVVNRLPVPEAKRSRWLRYILRCLASATHRVQAWNEPGKCPHCGTFLEKSGVPYRIWE